MATSGSIDFTTTAGDIITDALVVLKVYGPAETLHAESKNWALRQFNKMIKGMGSQGPALWAIEEATVLLDNDVTSYTFHNKSGTGGSVGAGVKNSSLVKTELGGDEAASQTQLTVDSSTGMTAADKIIIELDSGARHESTIASVDSATLITIDDALASAASEDNHVYVYTLLTDEIKHPQQIMNVRIHMQDDDEIRMMPYSRQDYQRLTDKTTEGRPYAYYFDKQLSNRVLHIYPEPSSLKERIVFDYLKTLEDVDALSDNIYFPDEWAEGLTYQLAVRLAPAFGKQEQLSFLLPLAERYLDQAMQADNEEATINFRPQWMGD